MHFVNLQLRNCCYCKWTGKFGTRVIKEKTLRSGIYHHSLNVRQNIAAALCLFYAAIFIERVIVSTIFLQRAEYKENDKRGWI